MTNDAHGKQSVEEKSPAESAESAFGRPASWRAAIPAVAAGLLGFLAAVYGTWWLPARLPTHYAFALQDARDEYQHLSAKSKTSSSPKLVDQAGEMDVIYSRLVGLEKNSPERTWEWADFLKSHARQLRSRLQDPVLSLRPETRKAWADQAVRFESKNSELMEQLAARPSTVQHAAILRVCQAHYRQGIGEYGVRDADLLANRLQQALEGDGSSEAGSLTAEEVEQAQLLLIQLRIEAAWQTPASQEQPASHLRLHTEAIADALQLYERFNSERTSGDDVQWHAAAHLLAAMTGREVGVGQKDDARETQATVTNGRESDEEDKAHEEETWRHELASLQLAALEGNWGEVTRALTSRLQAPAPQVTSGLARSVCRLACSPLAVAVADGTVQPDEQSENPWRQHADQGVMLACQLAPHLPECAELIWECAKLQASAGVQPPPQDGAKIASQPVSRAIGQAIMGGGSAWLKHSLAALSATLAEQPTVARTHLELLHRGRGNLTLIAQVVLWRSRASNTKRIEDAMQLKHLEGLMTDVTQIEPESGLNWFVLGTVQFHSGQFAEMRQSFERASKLLGEVPAIDQMLRAAAGTE